MGDFNVPNEILERIEELKLYNCIISKKPHKPIQLAYRMESSIIKEIFEYGNSHACFIIEVFSEGQALKLYLANSS